MTTKQTNRAKSAAPDRDGHDPAAEAGAGVSTARIIEVKVDPDPALLHGAPRAGEGEQFPSARAAAATRESVLHASWALRKDCAAISERMKAEGAKEEVIVLAQIAEYRLWLRRTCGLPILAEGVPDVAANRAKLGAGGAKATKRVKAAVEGLADLVTQDSPHFRSTENPEVDTLIDLYRLEMEDREHGLPCSGFAKRKCWRTVAKEIGCSEKQLTERRRRRLLMIDAEVGAGEMVGSKHLGGMRMKRVGVAVDLIREECERRRGRMPEDPLRPGSIDEAEVAEGAGVAVRDLTTGPRTNEISAMLEEARDGKKLVPHPLIAERRFDYGLFKEEGKKLRVAEAKAAKVASEHDAGRMTVMALTKFMSLAGVKAQLTDKVPLDFPQAVSRAIASDHGYDSGWPAQMRRWAEYYHQVRSARPLPDVFATAIKVLAVEVGLTRREVLTGTSLSVEPWIRGTCVPLLERQSLLDRLEDILKVTRGTLAKLLAREWRSRRLDVRPSDFGYGGITRKMPLDLARKSREEVVALMRDAWREFKAQDTVWSRRQSSVARDRYRLPFGEWTSAMQDAWGEQMPRTADRAAEEPDEGGLRVAGTRPSDDERHSAPKDEDRSWSEQTDEIGEFHLGYLFGFLVRPDTPAAEKERPARGRAPQSPRDGDPVFKAEPGLGIPKRFA